MILDRDVASALNYAILVFFTVLLLIGTVSTIARAVRMKRRGRQLPVVLKRDLVTRTTMALPVLLILLARAASWSNLQNNLLWILVTATPWLVSVAVYGYVELFVIERPSTVEREIAISKNDDEVTP